MYILTISLYIWCDLPWWLFLLLRLLLIIQSSAVSAASEAPGDVSTSVEEDRIGPDYFSYYARSVADFLSQRNDKLPCCSASMLYGGKGIWVPEKPIGESCGGSDESDHFATSGMDALMSDFREERLKLLLRESVRDLATEVDEVGFKVMLNSLFNGSCMCF